MGYIIEITLISPYADMRWSAGDLSNVLRVQVCSANKGCIQSGSADKACIEESKNWGEGTIRGNSNKWHTAIKDRSESGVPDNAVAGYLVELVTFLI